MCSANCSMRAPLPILRMCPTRVLPRRLTRCCPMKPSSRSARPPLPYVISPSAVCVRLRSEGGSAGRCCPRCRPCVRPCPDFSKSRRGRAFSRRPEPPQSSCGDYSPISQRPPICRSCANCGSLAVRSSSQAQGNNSHSFCRSICRIQPSNSALRKCSLNKRVRRSADRPSSSALSCRRSRAGQDARREPGRA